MATDVISVGNRMTRLDSSKKFYPLSAVVYKLNNEGGIFFVGDHSGREIEADNPFATNLPPLRLMWFRESLQGLSYQPYTSEGTLLNPAAEIGDAASMSGVYGGIYNRKVTFSPLMRANISAPTDEEVNHEYQFETQTEREFRRQDANVKASLEIQAGMIAAKVSRRGGLNATNSFSWELTEDGHRWYANGNPTPVMEVTEKGLTVRGVIEALSGHIGGFNIGSNSIHTDSITSFSQEGDAYGVYVGTDGIRLGSAFKVGTDGILEARSINLTGSIQFRDNNGNAIGDPLSTGYVYSGAGGGYLFNQARNYSTPSDAFYSRSIGCFGAMSIYSSGSLTTYGSFYCSGNFYKNGMEYHRCVATIDGTTIHYLGTD